MDNNTFDDIDDEKVDHLIPEGIGPPDAAEFSAETQRRQFPGSISQKTNDRAEKDSTKNLAEQSSPKVPYLSEITRNSPIEARNKINGFLNGIDPAYVWTDRKMAFNLERDEGYHSYYLEENGRVVGAYDYAINADGLASMYRMRTDPEASRRYLQKNGETLGDSLFGHFVENSQNQGANEAYAEVTEAGYRLIKRAGSKNAVTFTEDKQPSSKLGGYGIVRFKLPKN